MRLITRSSCYPGPAVSRDATSQPSWAAAVDIYENDSQFTLKADLPGLTREQIDIRIEDSTLTVSGERAADNEQAEQEKPEHYNRRERPRGKFHRRFRLPETVDDGAISAAYENGVLELNLPKQEQPVNSRVISVQ